jgi:hypothetical protein
MGFSSHDIVNTCVPATRCPNFIALFTLRSQVLQSGALPRDAREQPPSCPPPHFNRCSTPKPLLNRAGQEKDKLEVLREIGMTNVRITEGLTTLNQMTGAVPFFREFF